MDRKRRGSMMVEACGILPAALIFLMIMASAFRFLQLEETILFSGFDQIEKCSVEMAFEYPLARTSRLYLEHRIMTRTMEEMGEEQEDWIHLVGVLEDGMFFPKEQWNRCNEINCGIHCELSLGQKKGMGFFSDELYFSGRSYGGENQKSVWIFPNWGECYHLENCYVTGGSRKRTVMDVAEEQGYRPCQICMGPDAVEVQR